MEYLTSTHSCTHTCMHVHVRTHTHTLCYVLLTQCNHNAMLDQLDYTHALSLQRNASPHTCATMMMQYLTTHTCYSYNAMLNQTDQKNVPPHDSNAQPQSADTHICEDYVHVHPSVPTEVQPKYYIFGHDLQFHVSPQNG